MGFVGTPQCSLLVESESRSYSVGRDAASCFKEVLKLEKNDPEALQRAQIGGQGGK